LINIYDNDTFVLHGKPCRKVPTTRWMPPEPMTGMPEFIGREVALMTVYETIMVILGVIGSLISLGMLTVALLNFLDKRSKRK